MISPGTERAVLEIGRSSLVGKARARPDLVKKVVESARTEGVGATYAKVRGRLGEPNALGYSLSGTVLDAGEDAPAGPGELVACAGAGYASHAEVVAVPRLLCSRVPEGVAAEDAAYATLASIALHGVRLTGVGLGDVAAVVGLGLVGQLTLELLAAAGAVAVGIDLDERRAQLARDAGFFATTDARRVRVGDRSPDLRTRSRWVARDRGQQPLLGAASDCDRRCPGARRGVHRRRREGRVPAGRHCSPRRCGWWCRDPTGRAATTRPTRSAGIDYPAGYVRWTEGRNLEEVLRLMATGQLRPSRLTSHTFDLEDGAQAYALLESDEPSLGILLRYPERRDPGPRSLSLNGRRRPRVASALRRSRPRIGVVGAGAFARSVLMPPLARQAEIEAVATATGVSARASAKRFNARIATTTAEEVLRAPDLDGVVIATRHDTHAAYAAEALRAGKHVFVEKPLALDEDELAAVEQASAESSGTLMVGFNRRFAPLLQRMREALGGRGPIVVTYRVNAGRLPRSHWTHDPEVGGGRIVGEACHFVDVASYLAGAPPRFAGAVAASGGSEPRDDVVAATLTFSDGSIAQIVYSALGDSSLPKERVEVLGEAGAGVLDDFRELAAAPRRPGGDVRGPARQGPPGRDRCVRAELPHGGAGLAGRRHGGRHARDLRDPRRRARGRPGAVAHAGVSARCAG